MRNIFKHSWKTVQKDMNKQNDTPSSWIGWLNIIKILVSPIYNFNIFTVNIPTSYFMELGKLFKSSDGETNM